MKRFIIVLCAFFIAGCSSQTAASPSPGSSVSASSTVESQSSSQESSVTPSSQPSEDEPPINLDDIVLEKWLLEPNSLGTVYMAAKYTNNTDTPIVGVSFKVHLKDSNKTTFLDNYDTVLPGETSPDFECFGPSTGNMEDAEIISCEFTLQDYDGTKTYIDFDNKLGYMKWRVAKK